MDVMGSSPLWDVYPRLEKLYCPLYWNLCWASSRKSWRELDGNPRSWPDKNPGICLNKSWNYGNTILESSSDGRHLDSNPGTIPQSSWEVPSELLEHGQLVMADPQAISSVEKLRRGETAPLYQHTVFPNDRALFFIWTPSTPSFPRSRTERWWLAKPTLRFAYTHRNNRELVTTFTTLSRTSLPSSPFGAHGHAFWKLTKSYPWL